MELENEADRGKKSNNLCGKSNLSLHWQMATNRGFGDKSHPTGVTSQGMGPTGQRISQGKKKFGVF